MIITISGAACTGKTTLINCLKNRLVDTRVKYYEEFIRTMFDKKYSSKYSSFQDLLLGDSQDIIDIHRDTAEYFIDLIRNYEDDSTIMIFDRSPIDIAIYLYLNIRDSLIDTKVAAAYETAANYIRECILEFIHYNPTMLYTRPFKDVIDDDGFRPQSLIIKRELEVYMFDRAFGEIDAVSLPPELEERVSTIQDIVNNF